MTDTTAPNEHRTLDRGRHLFLAGILLAVGFIVSTTGLFLEPDADSEGPIEPFMEAVAQDSKLVAASGALFAVGNGMIVMACLLLITQAPSLRETTGWLVLGATMSVLVLDGAVIATAARTTAEQGDVALFEPWLQLVQGFEMVVPGVALGIGLVALAPTGVMSKPWRIIGGSLAFVAAIGFVLRKWIGMEGSWVAAHNVAPLVSVWIIAYGIRLAWLHRPAAPADDTVLGAARPGSLGE